MKRFLLSFAAVALALIIARAAPPSSAALDEAFGALARIDYGEDRAPLDPIEQGLAAAYADAALRQDLERRFDLVLESNATAAGKDYACRALKRIGTNASVPALASLLSEPDLGQLARSALEGIPGTAVDEALRDALEDLQGMPRVGAIQSIGMRQDRRAVSTLADLIDDPDPQVAAAAATALGKIANPAALRALARYRAQAPETRLDVVLQACFEAAQLRIKAGRTRWPVQFYQDMYEDGPSAAYRLAAFQGLADARPDDVETLSLAGLRDPDRNIRFLAARFIAEQPGEGLSAGVLRVLADLPVDGQLALLQALRWRADAGARASVLPLLGSESVPVRLAAIETLGVVGNEEDVLVLAHVAAAGDEAARETARQSLAALPGSAVNGRLTRMLNSSDSGVRVVLLRTLAVRGATTSAGEVAAMLGDTNAVVVEAAASTLGTIGTVDQVPVVIRRLASAAGDAERESLADALQLIARRGGPEAAPLLLAGLRSDDPAVRATLLRVLSAVGGEEGLQAVRAALNDSDAAVRDAAVRSLVAWPDPAAGPDLMRIAQTTDNVAHRVLAFRGAVRLARESSAPPNERLALLEGATSLAQSTEDKRLVVSALGEVPTVAALRLAAAQLKNPDLANEAGAAVVNIAAQLGAENKSEILPVLDEVLATAKAKPVLDEARRLRRTLRGE